MSRPRGRPPVDDRLTPAEWRTLDGIRHGLSNAAIARRRNVSVDAVKFHVANIIAKLGVADRRALRLWEGAARASALSRVPTGGPAAAPLGAIGQIARSVSSIEASETWYRDVLRLPHLFTFGTLAFFDCAGVRLMLSQQADPAPESILYFVVDDMRAAHADLSSRGVVFLGAPHLIHTHADGTEEWMAFFRDPDGRPLALVSRVRA